MLTILINNEVFNIQDKLGIEKKEVKEQASKSKSQENHGKNLFLAHKTENKFQDTKK